MKKFILHNVLGFVREYATKDELKNAIELICWGAEIKHTDIKDLDGNVHAYLFDYNGVGRYIIMDGGLMSVPQESTASIEADAYVLNLQNFKNWTLL